MARCTKVLLSPDTRPFTIAPTVVANRCTRWCTYTLLRVIDREREEREEEKRREERERVEDEPLSAPP